MKAFGFRGSVRTGPAQVASFEQSSAAGSYGLEARRSGASAAASRRHGGGGTTSSRRCLVEAEGRRHRDPGASSCNSCLSHLGLPLSCSDPAAPGLAGRGRARGATGSGRGPPRGALGRGRRCVCCWGGLGRRWGCSPGAAGFVTCFPRVPVSSPPGGLGE